MALAKDVRMPHDSCTHESLQVSDLSNAFVFRATSNYQPDHQVINFKSGYYNNSFNHSSESLLSFEKNKQNYSQSMCLMKTNNDKDEHSNGDSDHLQHGNYQWNQTTSDPRLSGDFSCFQTASNYSSISNTSKEDHGDEAYGWLYSDATLVADSFQEPGTQEAGFHKRPHTGENIQPLKKQCTNDTKKPKPKSSSPSKDPQSIAAKNRRERISERLKILQELVPNGCKVDLVTMLEKAISYVKFLQLQVKVLATDEFWPVQGGKAPDISQVKEAIDAILSSSQRDRSSSSK